MLKVHWKMRARTIMELFAEYERPDLRKVRFTFDGARVDYDANLGELGMENEDVWGIFVENCGC